MHASIDEFVMPEPAQVQAVVDRLRLLADGTRLRVLCALAQGESNPTCLAELAGVGVPAVSQHLAKLRLAGVVSAHREGQQVWYELVDTAVRELVQQLLAPPTAPPTTPRIAPPETPPTRRGRSGASSAAAKGRVKA